MPNRINATLTSENQSSALAGIDAAHSALPMLIDLSPEARKRMPRVDESALPVILQALEIARRNPDILRRSFDLDAMQTDADFARQLIRSLSRG